MTTSRWWCVSCVAVSILAGCVDKITGTRCEPTAFDVAEVRGDTIVTTTGLRWLEGSPGTGAALEWCQLTAVHFEGYLLDGSMFDGSRDGLPLIFTPGFSGVIPGFEQGVVGLRTGGTRRLIIPPGLGYGAEPRRDASGQVVIPANSTLVYDVEVMEIAP
jgi:FKBP-type peptidyl-prolyl cis-trans isomerase FkpA